MRKNDIKIGGRYTAKVNGKLVTVRVDDIKTVAGLPIGRFGGGQRGKDRTSYHVTNLTTGRKTVFHSAMKFREEVSAAAPQKSKPELTAARRRVEQIESKYSTEQGATEEERQEAQSLVEDMLHPALATAAITVEEETPSGGPVAPKQQGLADRLRAKKDTGVDTAPHLIVEARAGTGKTTTLVEGLKRVKGIQSTLTPSPQQAAVWDAMALSAGKAQTVAFVAFNKSIAEELKTRVPAGCEASTMHSMGFKAVTRRFEGTRLKVNGYRVQDLISDLLGRDIRELRKYKMEMVSATEKLVGLCKMNLLEGTADELAELAAFYSVELNGSSSEVFGLVPRVLDRCKDVLRDGCLDFDDMIWLPVVLDLPVQKYDLLLVDEAQDLNRCQQQLALKAGRRLVLCGDPKQAIYGFAGADAESMPRMQQILSETERGCTHLPLTVTRRCGKAIVKEAQKIVPDFEAFEANPEGKISQMKMSGKRVNNVPQPDGADYTQSVVAGDFLLCRVNAPLVQQCFRFIKEGRKANIQGRDIGQGLISTVKKTKAETVEELTGKLSDWLHVETQKENAKRNPSEQRLITLQDRYDCLMCFVEGATTVDAVIRKIEDVFTDSKTGDFIRLSPIHKSKGLEARRVFLLEPEGATVPHPMAKSQWAKEQEWNLRYVAITRAIEELVYVSGKMTRSQEEES